MKKVTALSLLFLLLAFQLHAQSGLYGLTRGGNGTISKYDASAGNLTAVYSFENSGTGPLGSEFIEGIDGKFYSTTSGGGKNNKGVLFSYDPINNSYSGLIDLTSGCTSVLTKGSGSMIYGQTSDYIFSYNTTTRAYSIRYNFIAAEQKFPIDGLISGPNGKFYGVANGNGGYGSLFLFDTSINAYTKLFDFNDAIGHPATGITLGPDNLLYGTLIGGSDHYLGTLFSFNVSTSTFQPRTYFGGANGETPSGRMILANNGKLYGVTMAGEHFGVIYSYEPSTSIYQVVHDFAGGAGGRLTQPLTIGSNGKLYGGSATLDYDDAILFSLDLSTNNFTVLHNFENSSSPEDQIIPMGKLLNSSNGKLYGTLANEFYPKKKIFSFDYSNSTYTETYQFVDYANGRDPNNSLIKANDELIGMTAAGGGYDAGVIFSFNSATSQYKKLHDFDSTNGKTPYGNLVKATNGLYYGMTNMGGATNKGVLFSFNLSTGAFVKLFDFNTANGINPYGSLILGDDNKFYGLASGGGTNLKGVLFSFDPSTNLYTRLFDFSETSGGFPLASLTKGPGGKLYGVNSYFGAQVAGTLFSFDPSTNSFAKLHDFNPQGGYYPRGGLLFASNGLLYGMTFEGGTTGNGGTIYTFNPNSNVFVNVHNFSNPTNASGSLMEASNGKLYGMTSGDGVNSLGTVFSFDPLNNSYTLLQSFDGTNGASPLYGYLTEVGIGNVVTGSKYIKVNVYGGANPYNDPEWNNWNTYSSLSSGNLKYSDGTTSSITATLSQQSSVSDNGVPYNSTMAPTEVVRYASYSTSNRTLTISGLDNSKSYDLEIYASRKGATNNTTRFTTGSTTIDILTDNNLSSKAAFTSLTPISGNITVTISKLNSYNYINGFVLAERMQTASNPNLPPTVDAGTNKSITLPTSTVQLNGSATDTDGSVVNYNWTKVSGPSQYSITNPQFANSVADNLVEGVYTFRLTVTDNQGVTAYDEVTVTVNPAPLVTKFVKVNLYGGANPYNNAEWNNWNSSSSLSSGLLKYSDGTSSSISTVLSQQNGISDNGTPYNATMAPPEVVRYASYSTSNRTLTISGLDNSKTYNLELYASRKGATNNTTRFVIGSTTINILTDNNLSNKASFTSITPSGGQIVVSISKLNAYNYLNGFILTENGASSSITRKEQNNLQEQVLSTSINAYPNPATDQIVLSVNNNYTGQMKVEIVDLKGVVVKQFKLSKNYKGISQNYLPVGDLRQGEYLVRIQTGSHTEVRKLLKL